VTMGDLLRSAVHGLSANRLRSALTMLGILIGVAAVILLVAVGNGSAVAVQQRLQSLGTNTLTVSTGGGAFGPGATQSTAQSLTLAVADSLADSESAPDVATVSPVQSATATVTAGTLSDDVSVSGTVPSWFEATNSPVAMGAAFTASDVDARARVAVLGSSTAEDLFPETSDPVGQSVTIAGTSFQVIGVLGAKDSAGPTDANAMVVAPLTTVRDTVTGYGALSSITVQATSSDTVSYAQNEVVAILDHVLGVDSSASSSSSTYRVQNASQLLETVTSTADTFTVLLGAVAAISLLVGGIGVTNIMLVTVTERTREIGIRKALGAQRGTILAQFLTEATILTLLGGAAGVVIGVLGSRFPISDTQPVVVPASIALAFGVSAAIGLVFGSMPANRAARLLPVEALRYQS
jgi:putative ABC transport system permease protein